MNLDVLVWLATKVSAVIKNIDQACQQCVIVAEPVSKSSYHAEKLYTQVLSFYVIS